MPRSARLETFRYFTRRYLPTPNFYGIFFYYFGARSNSVEIIGITFIEIVERDSIQFYRILSFRVPLFNPFGKRNSFFYVLGGILVTNMGIT